jgi:tetratricopeptide (TPR) repeat protein
MAIKPVKNIPKDPVGLVVDYLVSNDKHLLAHQVLDVFAKKANSMAEYDNLGAAALRAQHHQLQLRCAEHLYTHCTTTQQLFDARENLYKIYNSLNQPEKALFYIELNLKVKPNDSDTLLNKAFNLALLNKRKEAEDIIQSVAAESEEVAETIEYSLSGKLLREGQTAKGINGFISTFKPTNPLFEEKLKLKFWDGGAYPGKTIVINGEGGIGDEIINIRFLDHLKKLGMKPILYSSWHKYRPDTVDLFRRHGYEVVTNHLFFKKDYLWTHMMSLPGYLGLTEKELWSGPYLTPLRQEKNRLDDSKFKIGIKVSGNPWFEQDVYRKIPIEEMLACLPKDASVYYIDTDREYDGTISLKNRIQSWEDTLDFIDQMDIIVSSCTSLVHAAGAMGKETIVVVPIAEYYVWTSTRTDDTTPWYGDNFKVIRQTKVRSWKEPLNKVSEILKERILCKKS